MDGSNSKIRIIDVRDAGELKTVQTLAWNIFPETYRGMIPDGQIPYMMDIMYGDEVLRDEFSRGMKFSLIYDDAVPVGYISRHLTEIEGEKVLRLEKLYLDFAYHGRSIGNMALRYVIDEAARAGASFISLNVNRNNIRAQKAYIRAGFFIWRTEKESVGNGFFKDDYIMRYDISSDPASRENALQ